MKRLAWLIALVPFSPFACSGGGNTSDAGADAAHDGTTADVHDSSPDTALDAPKDVAKDTTPDVTASDASDGGAGDASDASDASTTDASDASTTDASDASTTDASDASTTDAAADAPSDATADAGSSWHTPTCDGVINPGEYGDSNYQITSQTQTWYMTWDATNLYVALANAAVAEGTVLYVGYSGNGLTSGQGYDGTDGTLSFPADAVVYAKHGYNEIRFGSGDAGTWVATNGTIQFCDDGNTTREEVIPWTALGASAIPGSFRFLGYATSSTGFVYGPIPTSNPAGQIGTTATFGHDFFVSSTADGSGAFPFATTE